MPASPSLLGVVTVVHVCSMLLLYEAGTGQSVAATVTSEGTDGNHGALVISTAVNKLGIIGNVNQSQAKELKVMKRILRFS